MYRNFLKTGITAMLLIAGCNFEPDPGPQENIELLEDSLNGLKGPSTLASKYDPTQGIARLYWKMDVEGETCSIHRRFHGQPFESAEALAFKVSADRFEDIVYPLLADSDTLTLIYSLVTEGARGSGPKWDFPPLRVIPPHFPFRPAPGDKKTDLPLFPVLNWTYHPRNGSTNEFDVYLGTGNPPTELVAEGLSSSRFTKMGILTHGTTYYWMVVAHEEGLEEIRGPVWSFQTRPSAPSDPPPTPSSPFPPDNADGVSATKIRLSWTGGDPDPIDQVFYDIYFAEASSELKIIVKGLTENNYNIPPQANGVTYKWQVIASNTEMVTLGPVWRFTTRDLVIHRPPPSPIPPDNSIDQPLWLTFSWQGGDPDGDNVTYNIRFGTSKRPTGQLVKGISSAYYDLKRSLDNSTTYYWFVTSMDNSGATSTGPVWNFTTRSPADSPPYPALAPNPPDSSMDQPLSLTLSWQGGHPEPGKNVTYDVYFGVQTPPPFLTGKLEQAVFARNNLKSDQSYFWRIKSSDGNTTTTSPVWQFKTLPRSPSDGQSN